MEYDFIEFDGQEKKFIPFRRDSYDRVTFLLDVKKYSDYRLVLVGREKGGVLINNRFVDSNLQERFYSSWSIDSLAEEYNSDSLHVTINESAKLEAYVTKDYLAAMDELPSEHSLRILTTVENSKKSLWVVLLVLSGFLLGLYRARFPKLFESIYAVGEVFRLRFRVNTFYEIKVLQSPNLLVYGLIGLLLALFFSMNGLGDNYRQMTSLNESAILVAVFFIGFLSSPFKYLIIRISAGLFGLSEYTKFHYMEYLRAALLIISLVVVNSFVSLSSQLFMEPTVVMICLLFAVVTLLFIKLLSNSVNKKLYLFSYICTTEIIPLLFIIKVFI